MDDLSGGRHDLYYLRGEGGLNVPSMSYVHLMREPATSEVHVHCEHMMEHVAGRGRRALELVILGICRR